MSDVEGLKAGLLQVIDILSHLPLTSVAEGLTHASASFASLMQDSHNPLASDIHAALARLARMALELEADPVGVEHLIQQLIASL